MTYVLGFLIWLVAALAAAALVRALYRAPATTTALTFVFAIFGAAVGGMLGVSGYIYHEPSPLRFGGILGAVLGALLFVFTYHVTARKAL